MDYEKKYLKYKSKYNLKKSSLVRGGGETNMKGGNINEIANLVFRNVPMINTTDKLTDNIIRIGPIIQNDYKLGNITWFDVISKKDTNLLIKDEWKPYIQFNEPIQFHAQYNVTISFKEGINPNTYNSRGQTLLFIAALNCNKIMFDALVAMGASLSDRNSDGTVKEKNSDGTVKGINRDGSTILHGIAWGGVNAQSQPIKTYDEKVAFMQEILQKYPRETIPLLFQVNIRGETFYDNLLMRHPDKISKSLEDVAFPFGWKREKNPDNKTVYVNLRDNISYLERPY